ncbi:hypothetical protein PC41400_08075 [Paenibacillus chitinolyticus]|uniref:Uncharacterized protein n=1 Tax=Paenibacillus chitinolyticus TaxID=79263 RepID=A0A410WTE6_9BACL|nr:hypothetical protein [Paenibacillus chitinolyticus]MCY9594031.1 hypothetical protein [Paenibacillus chitinolyticus]MCY9599136.1 hypothetical protein [Paenibacillus chitinolyticus]QAV17623.1 hypothetical protein PC41400_08075 [Paenibacillus chitinolyticus]
MTKAKNKKLELTLEQVTVQDEQYDNLKKVVFDDGAYTEVYEKFRPSRIETMIEQLANFLEEYEKHQGKIEDDSTIAKFLYLHVVVHFSTIVSEMPSEFSTKLDLFTKLADNVYVRKLEIHFDKSEVEKVYEMIFKRLDDYQNLIEQNTELSKKMSERVDKLNIQNKELLNWNQENA